MLPPMTPLQTSELQLFYFDGLLTVLYFEIPNLDGWGSEDLRRSSDFVFPPCASEPLITPGSHKHDATSLAIHSEGSQI